MFFLNVTDSRRVSGEGFVLFLNGKKRVRASSDARLERGERLINVSPPSSTLNSRSHGVTDTFAKCVTFTNKTHWKNNVHFNFISAGHSKLSVVPPRL